MRGSFKADPLPIIRAHWATLVDVRTGHRRYRDYAGFAGVPLVVFGVCLWRGVTLSATTAGALLTAIGLLAAFLFAVMLQVAARAVDWSDNAPSPGPGTSGHARFLRELAANAGTPP